MDKWNLIFDVALCNHCGSCTLAAMDEYVGNEHPGYSAPADPHGRPWIELKRQERGQGDQVEVSYAPDLCQHCDQAPCGAGQDPAVAKRPDGIVLIDPVKAKGRRDLVDKCPYGAVRWNEALQLPQIWTFDAHLLDQGWSAPRCQQSCPTGALRAVKLRDADMQRLAREDQLATVRPELGTAPRLYLRNHHRLTRRFIAGTVLVTQNGVADCLPHCTVTLWRGGSPIGQVATDWFGDFRFDHLPDEALPYELSFEHPDCTRRHLQTRSDERGTVVRTVHLMRQPAA